MNRNTMNKAKFSRFLFVSLIFFSLIIKVNAQEEKFKAIFIYNFTKHVSWPVRPGNFIISVLGNDDIIPEIEGIASKRMVGNLKIEVNKVNTPADIANCNIIFIPQGKSNMIAQVVEKAIARNILVITEKQNACSLGSDINFVSNGGKITFEISKANIEKYGLKVSGDLIQLGIPVN
jgi:hypothetical protein